MPHYHVHIHDDFEETKHPRAKSGSHGGEFVKKGAGGSATGKLVASPDEFAEKYNLVESDQQTKTSTTFTTLGGALTIDIEKADKDNPSWGIYNRRDDELGRGKGYASLQETFEMLAARLPARKKKPVDQNHKAGVGTKNSSGQYVASPTEPDLNPHEVYRSLLESSNTSPNKSEIEKQAITNYIDNSGYIKINECQRTLEDCSHIPEVKILTNYIGRAKTEKPLTLFRGINNVYADSVIKQLKSTGKPVVLEERGFTSLTTNRDTALKFAGGQKKNCFIVEVPQGSKIATVGNRSEQELVAQAGSHFVATGEIDKATGHYKLRLEQSHLK